MPKVPITGLQDFSLWYTPGVAAAALAIAKDTREAGHLTNRANSIAIVSDGTRVLGLGSIGPTAALPVMEGKALLFKYLGGVDAVPLCLAVRKESDLIAAVEALQPNFGGINLEDIEQPKCFRVLARLSRRLKIPVWHDDQQGSATVVLAGLMNALHVVGKSLADARIAMIGMGAANVATYRLLKASGVKPARIIACDSKGTLHRGRSDIARQHWRFAEKWRVARETNPTCIKGGIAQALLNADVAICFTQSGPDIINPAWVKGMAPDAIIFACANPVPEIWPTQAKAAGARIVATGRSDFPNQVNNALVFPGLFRGTLDCHASHITDEMALASAEALAKLGRAQGLKEDRLLPTLDDPAVAVEVAVAVGLAAKRQGLAGLPLSAKALRKSAEREIAKARDALLALTQAGLIAPFS